MAMRDRKSTRLNSSHLGISYAVFCLKKKNGTARQEHEQALPAARARECADSNIEMPMPVSAPVIGLNDSGAGPIHRGVIFFFNYSGTTQIFPLSPPGGPPI